MELLKTIRVNESWKAQRKAIIVIDSPKELIQYFNYILINVLGKGECNLTYKDVKIAKAK